MPLFGYPGAGGVIGGATYSRPLRRPEAPLDPDAAKYLAAVEAADGQLLENSIKRAVSDFVRGCKLDGIWGAIKASCILMGARTLSGALTPLAGTAPTNNNFVSGDYTRRNGLAGNASNKTLNSNRNNNADGQNDFHSAIWVHAAETVNARAYFGAGSLTTETGSSNFGQLNATQHFFRCRTSTNDNVSNAPATGGLLGVSRSASGSYTARSKEANTTINRASQTPVSANLFLFSATNSAFVSGGTFSFYSIGGSLDLALLDSRVKTLYDDIRAFLP